MAGAIVGRRTLVDLAEDDDAGKLGVRIAGDGWVKDEDALEGMVRWWWCDG